jgi:uncharacterized membrane protein
MDRRLASGGGAARKSLQLPLKRGDGVGRSLEGIVMRRSDGFIVAGLALAVIGYWLTTLGTQSYRWAPDWVWYNFQQRPTLVVVGVLLAVLGVYCRVWRRRR